MRLIEFRVGFVTVIHQRTVTLVIPLIGLLVSLLFVALLFASIPFSLLFWFISLVAQFMHHHNVCLPMAIMASEASCHIINSQFPLLNGNVSQYSLGHVPKKEQMGLLICLTYNP